MNQMEQNDNIIRHTRYRQMDRIQILTTLNGAYLSRLQVLLTSIRVSQPEEEADIWLMHSGGIRIPSAHDRQCCFCRCTCQPTVSP